MFSARSGGSKVALAALALRLHAWGFPLVDAQVENPHLLSLGAEAWRREDFLAQVDALTAAEDHPEPWTRRFGSLPARQLAC
jgi:leucyl/phenylalanyl-tRNA--protein transferase